jgi:hypothetical protein
LSKGDLRVTLVDQLGYLEIVLCLAALTSIVVKKQWSDYWSLGWFLAVRIISSTFLAGIMRFGRGLGPLLAYNLYFGVYWISFALESVVALVVVYSVFRLAMAPLKGLQTLGMLVFKWAAAISVAVALGSVFVPNMTGMKYLVAAISQLQRTQSILTICLLLFVCFAIRPMGLSYSSRIFGVSLGLGTMATVDLVQSAWLALKPEMGRTTYDMINGVVICAILATWTAYFALPEPKRRIIVLPTTSPFLRWNQISQALGDSPGFVAVGGVPPELFAPAELEVMRRASLKMVTQFPGAASERAPLSIAASASRAI